MKKLSFSVFCLLLDLPAASAGQQQIFARRLSAEEAREVEDRGGARELPSLAVAARGEG